MSTWFITRHPGARRWAEQQRLVIDRYCVHFDPAEVARGDTVIGSLPVHLAAAVCAAGARYVNLSLDLSAQARGKELSAEELTHYNPRLEEYTITAKAKHQNPHG